MLNGVGGNTIEKAKEAMTYREFKSWSAYRMKRGPLNPSRKIERSIAMLATLYANAHSKNPRFRLWDFCEHEEEPAISLEQAKKQWH